MIIEKRFITSVVLTNPKDIYSSNINKIIIQELKKRFEKKTYKSSFILEILKINRRSLIRRGNDLNSHAYIDVDFLAKSLIYDIGEIIANCRIIRRAEYGAYYCSSDYAKIELKFDKFLSILYNNTKFIPIKVIKTKYDFLDKEIKIISEIYKPQKEEDHYFIVKAEDNIIIQNKIEGTLRHQKNIQEKLNDIIKKDINGTKKFNSFLDILYPYEKKIDPLKIYSKMQKIDIDHLKFNKNKSDTLYLKPQIISKYNNICLFTTNKSIINDIVNNKKFTQITMSGLFEHFINQRIKYLNSLLSFMTTFKTLKDIQDNDLYFKLYKKNKLLIKNI